MAPDDLCSTPFGEFVLRRTLPDRTGALRAWDGADLLLLDHLSRWVAGRDVADRLDVLVVGDRFGALSVALHRYDPWILSDSMASAHAIDANRVIAGLSPSARIVESFGRLEQRTADDARRFDAVVWHVDRSTDVVVDVATRIGALCQAGSVLFAAGMDKHLPPRTAEILRGIGGVTTHPGRRKAHCFEVVPPTGEASFATFASSAVVPVTVAEHDLIISGAPGVFSSDRLDLGARLLAAQIASAAGRDPSDVIDLGCGNGILGIVALRTFPHAQVHFIDESAAAVATSRGNVVANVGVEALTRCTFTRSDVFDDVGHLAADLIVCNPPFHHANAIDDEVAWRMLSGARTRLRPGGELWVVGNRHLGYHAKLRRLFGTVRQLAEHPKFVVLAAMDRQTPGAGPSSS